MPSLSNMVIPCSACGCDAKEFFRVGDVNRRISNDTFPYFRCGDCGFIFLSPIPSDLGRYYPTSYYDVPASATELARRAEPERYKVDLIREHVAGGRLLEIGPAYGSSVWVAKRAGFEVDVIEMDARCCRFLREEIGVNAICSSDTLAELAARPETYDVIALWQVIEHLPDPWETVRLAARSLRRDGVLVIATPNPDSLQFRIFGRYWTHVDAPRHLCLIPAPLLVRKTDEAGLTLAEITTRDRGSRGWNGFGWQMTLANFGRGALARSALRNFGRGLSLLARPADRSGLRGSSYTGVFRKVS